MRLPRSLKVGPHRYKIVVDHHGLMEGSAVGHCNADRLVIGIDPRIALGQQADTLLHEALHGLLAAVKLEDDTEEAICLVLSPGLMSLFADNPALYPFLVGAR